jgi:glutamyl-tRNA synthetase
VVVDDIDMDITHVIRGEDHIANTAKQILLYRALGALEPVFAHTPLILNSEGRKLSKRDGVTSIDDFRKMGFLPEALANYMTLLGWTPPDAQEIFSLEQASSQFELERVNRAGAKFDWDKLDWINSQYIHNCSTEQLMELLLPYWQQSGYQINQIEDRDWLLGITELIKGSLKRLSDAPNETNVLFGSSIEFTQEAIDQLKIEQVGNILRDIAQRIDEPLDNSVIDEIINTVTKTHNVKKGLVMKSLRAALMGSLQGHDLKQSWLLLNKKGWDKPRLASALELI